MKLSVAKGFGISWNRETMLNLMLCVVWSTVLLFYMRGIINRLPVLQDFTEEIVISFVVATIVLSIPALLHKFCLADYLFYIVLAFYYLSSYVFFPQNSDYLTENAVTCLLMVFPFYFVGRIVNIDKLFGAFTLLSAACIFMDLFYYLVFAQQNKVMAQVSGDDNMFASYQALPHVTFMLWSTLKKFRLWKAATVFFGFLFMLSCGTRGPLVCLGFFGIVYFLFYMKFKGATYLKLAIVATVIVVIAYLNEVVFFLVKQFTSLKLSTRILEKLVTGELGDDSQRSVLREKIYSILDSGDHFWGLGPFGYHNFNTGYSHFLPLDVLCTFGYFTGYIVLFLLTVLAVAALWKSRGTLTQELIVFLMSISVVKLMLSSTFLFEPYFFMLIGTCVGVMLSRIQYR